MSAVAPSGEALGSATMPCPRCAAPVEPEQSWCLRCGLAARSRLVPTPSWQVPVAIVAVLVALALVVIAVAFVALTNDPGPSSTATTTTTAAPAP